MACRSSDRLSEQLLESEISVEIKFDSSSSFGRSMNAHRIADNAFMILRCSLQI